MITAVAVVNLILGTVYTSYGVMTIIDMKRGWKSMGYSHFGAAWIAMAFTCGPHHFTHGLHALTSHGQAGSLDLAAVLVGFPAGIAWFLLRIEAFAGGRGDRFVSGNPSWVLAIPTMSGVYVTALIAAMARGQQSFHLSSLVLPNVFLIGLYFTIGYFLSRTQLRNRSELGGWSISGLSLAIVFPTCGLMHAVYAFYSSTSVYAYAGHVFWIDWLAVPAAAYFLWVVHGLYVDALQDWNRIESERLATVAS